MDKYRKDILIETFHYFGEYNDFLNKNDILFIINHIDIFVEYYNMIHNEYILFLPKSYFYITKQIPKCINCFIKNEPIKYLKNVLEEENVTLISYEKKNEFVYLTDLINRFHKKYPLNDFIENYMIKIGKILYNQNPKHNKYYLLNNYKPKEYYFYENNILPFILYKKIKLSNIIQFISLEHYAYKKNEYMLRSFSQIAEELGAIKIHISNDYKKEDEKILLLGLTHNHISNKEENKDKHKVEFDFAYSENNYINLNEFLLNGKILNENKFLLCKDDYESNIELKYLIHARSRNFIEKYYTQFKNSTLNSKELHIFLTLKDYHINIQSQNICSEKIETNLQIDFLNVLNHPNLIDGSNIYPLKEGYIYLKQIILKDRDFRKYINFMKAHLHALQNKYVYLAYDYEYIDDIMKIYHQSIELNFEEKELIEYISKYWENQNEWYHFTLLRDIILLGNDNLNNKMHFVTFQYMNIFRNKYNLLKKIETCLSNFIDKVLDEHITKSIDKYNDHEIGNQNMNNNNNDVCEEDLSDEELKKDKEEFIKKINKKVEEVKVVDDFLGATTLRTIRSEGSSKVETNHEYINHIKNFINNVKNENVDYISMIVNKLNHYEYLEDSVIQEEENITTLYFKHVQSKSIKNMICENSNYDFDIKIFKEKLKNNHFQKKIIELIIKGIKGSFYYENGISNNIFNINKLKKIINDVIQYYFLDEIHFLQKIVLYDMFEAKDYPIINIITFIEELLNKYFNDYYQNQNQNHIKIKREPRRMKSIEPNNKAIHDSIQPHIDDNSSPKIIDKNNEEMCILNEAKNIFIKFIYKECDKINSHDEFIKKIDEKFPLHYLLTNYRKYRLFYTYHDYKLFIKEIKKL